MKMVLHNTLNHFLHKSLLNYKKYKEVLINFIL